MCIRDRIGGPDEVFTARQRMLGYMKALKAHGIAVDEKLICHGDYTIQGEMCIRDRFIVLQISICFGVK